MADVELIIKISEEDYKSIKDDVKKFLSMPSHKVPVLYEAVNKGVPLTVNVLADMLMEERIRGELNSDTDFVKDIIPDVRCKLTVGIKDNRPCYCAAALREVWRESEVQE